MSRMEPFTESGNREPSTAGMPAWWSAWATLPRWLPSSPGSPLWQADRTTSRMRPAWLASTARRAAASTCSFAPVEPQARPYVEVPTRVP